MNTDITIKIKKADEILTRQVKKNGTNAYIPIPIQHTGKKAKVIILE